MNQYRNLSVAPATDLVHFHTFTPNYFCRLYLRPASDAVPLPPRPFLEQLQTLFSQYSIRSVHIGCGVGKHPINQAKESPHTLVIAIEHTKEKYGKMMRQLQKEKPLPNLLPIHGNAITWIYDCIADESIDQIYIMYPNPEHQNKTKRWSRMPFFRNLILKLKDCGTIQMATNILWYMDEFRALCQQVWCLEEIHYEVITTDSNYRARTHFEEKYLKRGENCYDTLVAKGPNILELPTQEII